MNELRKIVSNTDYIAFSDGMAAMNWKQ